MFISEKKSEKINQIMEVLFYRVFVPILCTIITLTLVMKIGLFLCHQPVRVMRTGNGLALLSPASSTVPGTY